MMRAVALLAVLLPAVAFGQVSTNQSALDKLGPAGRKPAAHARAGHAVRPGPHAAAHAHPAAARPAAGHPASVAARIGRPPAIPLHPPPPPIIAPPALHVEQHPQPPPPPVPVVAKAAGAASPIRGGVRITFGPDSSDLNTGTDQALHGIAALMKADPSTVADVDAYAPGSQDDPSSPRRLSLARALAARAVLINDGIPSTRIYARALGDGAASGSDPEAQGPPDRLDIAIRSTDAPAKAAIQ